MVDSEGMITIRALNKKTGQATIIKVRQGTPMSEVFKEYAAKKGMDQNTLTFLNQGGEIDEGSTTESLGRRRQDHTVIDASECSSDMKCGCFAV